MSGFLKRRWHRACSDTIGTPDFWRLAVDHATIKRALDPMISEYAGGKILDVGAGRLAWRDLLARRGEYISSDIEATHPDVVVLFDVQKRFPFEDGEFDTLFCCSVLEHVPEPWAVLAEFRRTLRPGGHAIISVPFMYYIHGAPHDYWRFSPFGVRQMAAKAGLEVTSLELCGGLGHTLMHGVSIVLASLLWNRRIRWPTFAITVVLSAIGRAIDHFDRGAFPQNVNVVLRRPTEV